ncbi:MAG: indole-3-glycerol phosphate synthase TrpC [Armatimonadetes bacterium]|nr:indole-3-glycerol phosphate synthase TrpC [Armatimonadota bacterium]
MNVLDRILQSKRDRLPDRMASMSLDEVRSQAADAPPTLGFLDALLSSEHDVSLIAEVKKASPVQGVLRESFDAVEIAQTYKLCGADCLSVLTDVEHFQGHPSYVRLCRSATGLPTLRKDFTIHEYDVYEARALGADAVLLIVSALERAHLQELLLLAGELGMDALVEAHSLDEALVAVEIGAKLVGLNNRDLETFEVNIEIARDVIPQIAGRATVVSESALNNNDDVRLAQEAGARAVLIGTSFCTAPDIAQKVREVMGW